MRITIPGLRHKWNPSATERGSSDDGRILASVPAHPGVMAYGVTEAEAIRKVKSIALQILADMTESGDDVSNRRVSAPMRIR